jgi:hypothetical protein
MHVSGVRKHSSAAAQTTIFLTTSIKERANKTYRKSKEQTGLSNAAVTDQDELEQVVVISLFG